MFYQNIEILSATSCQDGFQFHCTTGIYVLRQMSCKCPINSQHNVNTNTSISINHRLQCTSTYTCTDFCIVSSPHSNLRMFIPFLFQLQPLVAHMNQGTIVSMMDHWVRSERLPRAMPPRHAGVVRDASTCARCPRHQRWRNGHLQENEITKWAVLSFLELVDWKNCVCFSVKGHEWDTTMGIY